MFKLTYEQLRIKMSSTSRVLGIIAIAVSVLVPGMIFVSFGLGFLAILIGFLSKGYSDKYDHFAKLGTILGTISVVASILIGVYSFNAVLKSPDQLKEVLSYADTLYGSDYEELYGKNVSEMFNEVFGDIINE